MARSSGFSPPARVHPSSSNVFGSVGAACDCRLIGTSPEARVAVAKNDLATAKSKAAEYVRLTAPRNAPFELRQQRELAGLIALAEKRHAAALEEFSQANQRDPRVLLLMAEAAQGAGNAEKATAFAQKAARFNELSFNFAYVKKKAERFKATSL